MQQLAGPAPRLVLVAATVAALLLSVSGATEPTLNATAASTALSRRLQEVPPYERGPGYRHVLSYDQRRRGLGYVGSGRRLRAVLEKLAAGNHIHVTAVGGSVTAGLHGARDGHSWPEYLFNFLDDRYPGQVTGHNGAVPGTISSYMSACVNIHVPRETDIVLVEYSVNDPYMTKVLFDNEYRRAYERLLRKLLNYPNNPAVVLMHSYNWMAPPHGVFWNSIERELLEMSYYYDIPSLSLKAATYHQMQAGVEGFQVETPRHDDIDGLAGKSFYWDKIHPDSLTGLRAMGEIAMHLIESIQSELSSGMGTSERADAAPGNDVPTPMVPGNFEAISDRCFIGENFKNTIVKAKDFDWANDSNSRAEKWGYISTVKNAELHIQVNTLANSASADKVNKKVADLVMVQVAHVKSYETMAAATLKCISGCTCDESIIEGHLPKTKNTQLYLHVVYVSQAEECVLSITVPYVRSDHYKVKIAGIIVSEETGEMVGADKTQENIEMVHTVTGRGGGEFDVRNKQRNPLPKSKGGRRLAQAPGPIE